MRHDLYPFINKIVTILAFTVNNFPPLLDDDEDEEFEMYLRELPEEEEPDEEQFVVNDRFIADFDDKEDDMIAE